MENKEWVKASLLLAALIATGFAGYQFGTRSESGAAKDAAVADHSVMTMDEMTAGLSGLSGDAFDKAFVEMMIVHHQGAVDMAALIPANAKHEELKRLGQDIIATQTKEIAMMQQWLKDWGYLGTSQKIDEGGMMMDHGAMPGMAH